MWPEAGLKLHCMYKSLATIQTTSHHTIIFHGGQLHWGSRKTAVIIDGWALAWGNTVIATSYYRNKGEVENIQWFKVTGYKMGRGPCSKHDNSQCSIAPDCGYKRWSTDREAPHACTQPEGMGYLVRAVFYKRSNLRTFEPKSDHPSNQKQRTIL